jgi:hypothetical protein
LQRCVNLLPVVLTETRPNTHGEEQFQEEGDPQPIVVQAKFTVQVSRALGSWKKHQTGVSVVQSLPSSSPRTPAGTSEAASPTDLQELERIVGQQQQQHARFLHYSYCSRGAKRRRVHIWTVLASGSSAGREGVLNPCRTTLVLVLYPFVGSSSLSSSSSSPSSSRTSY